MAAMFSSTSNDSDPKPQSSSSISDMNCLLSQEPRSFVFTAYNIGVLTVILPLCIYILHHGLQQWMKERSSSSSAAALSHSDCFTYHLATMELCGVLGSVFNCVAIGTKDGKFLNAGRHLMFVTWYGEVFFHLLTCVERYLAVVHPITYLRLRSEQWIRIRNISISFVWLFPIIRSIFMNIENFLILELCLIALSLASVFFCSISVLRVLIRPGPGKQGGTREKVDKSKQRAFHTIVVILAVLFVKFITDLFNTIMLVSGLMVDCLTITCSYWLNIPCSLVLPLLFLHRLGKCTCCKAKHPASEKSANINSLHNLKRQNQ